jgi:hypothetical protein
MAEGHHTPQRPGWSWSTPLSLLLEAVLAVPSDELQMWTVRITLRQDGLLAGVDDGPDAVGVVCLTRHQYAHIVIQTNEPAIEHPVRGARQRNAIADDVGAVCVDWTDNGLSGCNRQNARSCRSSRHCARPLRAQFPTLATVIGLLGSCWYKDADSLFRLLAVARPSIWNRQRRCSDNELRERRGKAALQILRLMRTENRITRRPAGHVSLS